MALGVYASAHDPTLEKPYQLWFTDTINLKVWFATAALLLVAVQVVTALRLYGKLSVPKRPPALVRRPPPAVGHAGLRRLPPGRLPLPLVPRASRPTTPGASLHSLLGCLFYGAFATKVLVVRANGLPGWALPVVGGVVLTTLVGAVADQRPVVLHDRRLPGALR